MSQLGAIEPLAAVQEITEPLAIKDTGNIQRFNEAAERNLSDLRGLSLDINTDLVPKLNTLVALLNQQLPYINTVSAADAAIRTNANNIASINTLATHIAALLAVNLRLGEVQAVADNMAGVLAAQGYAEEAHRWAVVAETIGNVGIATTEKAGLVKPGVGLTVDALGTLGVVALTAGDLPGHAGRHGADGDDAITSLGPVTVSSASLGPVSEKAQTLGTISGTVTIDLSAGLSISATIGGATTLTFAGVPTGGAVVVVLTLTNGGSATVTWPTAIAWAGSKAPALTAAGKDMIVLATSGGGVSWRGSASLKYGAGA